MRGSQPLRMHPLTEKRILTGLGIVLATAAASAVLCVRFADHPGNVLTVMLAAGGMQVALFGSLGWLATLELRTRRRRELDLREAEHFCERMADSSGDCVAVLSSAGLVL